MFYLRSRMNLTDEQDVFASAFAFENGNNLLIALPGSGKTTSSLAATVRLVNENSSALPWLISFSNAAASNMAARLKLLLNKNQFERVGISTFHAINLDQYKKLPNAKKLLIGPSQSSMLFRAMKLAKSEMDIKEAQMEIDQLTRKMTLHADEKTALFKAYIALLNKYNCIDFNLLCIEVVKAMRGGTLPTLNITHLLVDEFQDTDEVQLGWMKCHAQKGVNVSAVGDDDQSIYRFRGALGFDVMDAFIKQFSSNILYLSKCFRCGETILYAAEMLITNNKKRLQKSMQPSSGFDGHIEIVPATSKEEQLENVADNIQQHQGEWAILARNNGHLDEVEMMLSMKKIQYQRLQSGSIWDSLAADATLKLLEIIYTQKITQHSHDALAFYSLSESQIDELMAKKGMGGLSATILDMELPPKTKKLLFTLVAIAGDTSNPNEINQKIERIRADTAELISNKRDETVVGVVLNILRRQEGSWREMLKSLVSKLASRRNKKIELDSTLVALTTLHGSKGLEFENVAIINNTHGVFPGKDITESEDIEEERRLMFVGMTRAIKRLEMHYYDEPNRFISEIIEKMT